MVKTTITETTEKFDENGKLVERVIRTEESDDDTIYYPNWNTTPLPSSPSTIPLWWQNPTCVSNMNECDLSVK